MRIVVEKIIVYILITILAVRVSSIGLKNYETIKLEYFNNIKSTMEEYGYTETSIDEDFGKIEYAFNDNEVKIDYQGLAEKWETEIISATTYIHEDKDVDILIEMLNKIFPNTTLGKMTNQLELAMKECKNTKERQEISELTSEGQFNFDIETSNEDTFCIETVIWILNRD